MHIKILKLRHFKKLLRFFNKTLRCTPLNLEEMPDCPALFKLYRAFIGTGHERVPGGWIYQGAYYPDYLTMGGASLAIARKAKEYCIGTGLDIGAGFWPFNDSIPIDTEQGPGYGTSIDDIQNNSKDFVFSSHCLEHIDEWEKALDLWISKIKPGGIIFLYLPHPSCKLWHMSNPLMEGIHKWVPDPVIVHNAFTGRGLIVLDKDDGPDHFYSFYICAKKPRQ